MATRVLSRRSRRVPPAADVIPVVEVPVAAAPKRAAKPKAPRKKTVKAPPRTFARWAVCDGALKHVAVFAYCDRVAADAKLADMLVRKTGGYYMQLVKGPAPVEALVV